MNKLALSSLKIYNNENTAVSKYSLKFVQITRLTIILADIFFIASTEHFQFYFRNLLTIPRKNFWFPVCLEHLLYTKLCSALKSERHTRLWDSLQSMMNKVARLWRYITILWSPFVKYEAVFRQQSCILVILQSLLYYIQWVYRSIWSRCSKKGNASRCSKSFMAPPVDSTRTAFFVAVLLELCNLATPCNNVEIPTDPSSD